MRELGIKLFGRSGISGMKLVGAAGDGTNAGSVLA